MSFCGIDFGTSNSALAVASAGKVRLARVEGESITMPSAIFYHDDGRPVYGREAIGCFFGGDGGRLMRSFKRTLGTDLLDYGAIIGGKLKKYDHIIASYVRRLKTEAEKDIGREIDSAVMGRPVHFVDGDPKADEKAQAQLEGIARLVGFKHVEFQLEPIAAAFAHERNIRGEKLALVVDIGGGTSDFTVIRLSNAAKTDRKNDILASAGVRIGGNDFDRDFCLQSFMPYLGYDTGYGGKGLTVPRAPFHDLAEWSKVNFLYVPKVARDLRELHAQSHKPRELGRFLRVVESRTGYKVLSCVEQTKIDLTARTSSLADLSFLEEGLEAPLTRRTFNDAVAHHVGRIMEYADLCLAQAGIARGKIQLVILTGGTTEVPLLQETVRQAFPSAEIFDQDKLSSVGLGLGYDSLRRFGAGSV